MKVLHRLARLSHSVKGITGVGALMLLFGAFLSGGIASWSTLRQTPGEPEPDPVGNLYLRFLRFEQPGERAMEAPAAAAPLVDRVFAGPEDAWRPELEAAAPRANAEEGIRFAMGLFQLHRLETDAALRWMHAENEAFPSRLVRSMEIHSALQNEEFAYLDTLAEDPVYAEQMRGWVEVERGARTGDWRRVLRNFWHYAYGEVEPLMLALALVSGLIWSALLFSLLPDRPSVGLLGGGGLALLLGAASTWPTLWSLMWMEQALGIHEGPDFLSALYYYVVSVGLREEVCKLLLFAPLLGWTARRGRDLESLLLGALVGLGFAVEENLTYFSGYAGSGVAASRYVSANLLHFTLTGCAALALTRAVRDPGRWAADGLQVLAMVIGLHGLYDTLLSQPVPGLGDMGYLSGTVLAGCAWLFFREVEALAPLRVRRVSRTAGFAWGFCLLAGLELALVSTRFPFNEALYLAGQGALSGVFTGYIFVHCIREPLRP